MQTTSAFRAISFVAAFTGGIVLACESSSQPNPEHCFNDEGDRTCAELYGEERPFCVGPGESCDVTASSDGCVAELPPIECYSPCGDKTFATDDSSCLPSDEGDGDGDGDGDEGGDGDGDPTGDGDGDGDPPSPICGDGVVEGDEECDDGNPIDDDECSNTCSLPICGDGIVQSGLGESCDDGNNIGGDGCAASCVLPGTTIWSRFSDIPNAQARAVAVAPNGNIGVLAYSTGVNFRVLSLTPDGELMWNEPAPPQASGIAVTSSGQFVVGGVVNDKGQVWLFEPNGERTWTGEYPSAPTSTIRDVAVDGYGFVYSVGSAYGAGMVLRQGTNADYEWVTAVLGSSSVDKVAAAVEGGGAWVLRNEPRQVLRYDHGDELVWTSMDVSPLAEIYGDLAADSNGNAYLVGDMDGALERFGVARFNGDGGISWMSYHDDPEVFEAGWAIATLPTGGVIVAGVTNNDGQSAEADGLLSWFAPDGTLMQDFVYDVEPTNDADWLQDVAVGPDGNIVAVGFHQPAGDETQLWMMKVAM